MNMIVRRSLEKRRKGAPARGFTLVEIIVVLAIIAILAAVAIPSLIGYIDKADEAEVKQNLATCAKAMQTWASERYADNIIGQELVTATAESSKYPDETESLPIPPGSYPTMSPTSATTWLGIAEEYAKLSLDPDVWTITDVEFDDRNTLMHFWLHRGDPDRKAEYNAAGGDGDEGNDDPGEEPTDPPGPTGPENFESFEFTIIATDGKFLIPTSGYNSSGSQNAAYEWEVSVDGGDYQSYSSPGNSSGININTQLKPTTTPQLIKIRQAGKTNDDNDYQWFRAFGFGLGSAGASAPANKEKMATLVSPLPEKGMCVESGRAGGYFGMMMFFGCNGDSFTMGDAFTLPQGITSVGFGFCSHMFYGCSGDSFKMGAAFNLPQVMNEVEGSFLINMFADCYGQDFQVNTVFKFPQTMPNGWRGISAIFEGTFAISAGAPDREGEPIHFAQSIVGVLGQPSWPAGTFSDARSNPQWKDYNTWLSQPENSNWK
jgi:prepilin-type N-terminal cleavage/methylation domain-containing protein